MSEKEFQLHIDDDWKSEAAAEKERLAQTVESQEPPPPEASFSGLVQTLAMQAMVGLGGFAGADGRPLPPNPDLAKFHIDLLDVLEAKTKGNLTPEEKKLLDGVLHELRMTYVQVVSGGTPRPR